jgi:CRISPR-associated protein (TIGR02584 family)
MRPERDWRNVLLAVVGLTPQVVTETLYYLTQVREVQVHEICIITTVRGRELAEQLLLRHGEGALHRFCAEYRLDADRLHVCPIVVLQDRHGNPLEDIRTVEENEAAANGILRVVADYTRDDSVRLFCSLAGGRKTMSTFAGFAMQLLGRTQDELLHVLVRPPELESRRDFFYPPSQGDFLATDPSGKTIHVPREKISIDCAEVPFVRLRNWLPRDVQPGLLSYSELVAATQFHLDVEELDLRLELQTESRILTVRWAGGEKQIRLQPRQAALLHFFLEHAGEEIDSDRMQALLPEIDQLYQNTYVRGTSRHSEGWDLTNFSNNLTRLNDAIAESGLPPTISRLCRVDRYRSGGYAYYCLRLPKERCRVIPSP